MPLSFTLTEGQSQTEIVDFDDIGFVPEVVLDWDVTSIKYSGSAQQGEDFSVKHSLTDNGLRITFTAKADDDVEGDEMVTATVSGVVVWAAPGQGGTFHTNVLGGLVFGVRTEELISEDISVTIIDHGCAEITELMSDLATSIDSLQVQSVQLRAEKNTLESSISTINATYEAKYQQAIAAGNLVLLESTVAGISTLHPALRGWAGVGATAAVAGISDAAGNPKTDKERQNEALQGYLDASSEALEEFGNDGRGNPGSGLGKGLGLLSKALAIKDLLNSIDDNVQQLAKARAEMKHLEQVRTEKIAEHKRVMDELIDVHSEWTEDYAEFQELAAEHPDCVPVQSSPETPGTVVDPIAFEDLPNGDRELDELADNLPEQRYDDFFKLGAARSTFESTNQDDIVIASRHHNHIDLGRGNDLAAGRGGNDTINGGAGHDWIDGGNGADLLRGNAGADIAYGGNGGDIILVGVGRDIANGGRGDDELRGGRGNDLLLGRSGSDSLYGGAGQDTLIGGRGADYLDGGAGADCFVFRTGDGKDTIAGFSGDGGDIICIESGASSFDDLNIRQVGADAIVTFSDVLIVFSEIDAATLSADHFSY